MKPSPKAYVCHLVRLLFVLLWCTLSAGAVSAMLSTVFAGYDATSRVWQSTAGTVACLLIFFFTVRAMVVRDPLYVEIYQKGTYALLKHLAVGLRSFVLWGDLVLTLASLLIAARVHPLHLPIQALAYLTEPPQKLFYAYVLGVSFPLYALLFFLAQVRARGKMHALYAQQTSAARRTTHLPTPIAFLIACVEPTLVLAVLCAILPLVFSVVMLLVKALGRITVWVVIGMVALYLIAFRYTRAIVKRQKFRRALCRVAEELGDEVVFHRRAWASLFVSSDKADFTLWHKRRRYDGKFLHSLRTFTPMVFDGTGTAALHRIFRIHRVELFRTVTVQSYTFDSEGERVVIILPTPKELRYVGGGAHRSMDVGDRIGAYTFFNANGFLRAIERDRLDRGEILKRT